MIKYLGSKRKLLSRIGDTTRKLVPVGGTIADLFSGTARVGHFLKKQGYEVHSNDITRYGVVLAQTYVEADWFTYAAPAMEAIEKLQQVDPVDGYFTETFCRKSRFFTVENGMKIDGVWKAIREREDDLLKSILLTSLMEAADRVDSTTGVQMAYLKSYAPRALKPLELRLPDMTVGGGLVTMDDATEIASAVYADMVYLDPPYNHHSYVANYHIWETLCQGDEPETYGVACKRIDTKENKSVFNSKKTFLPALLTVVREVEAPYILLSFNNEGYVSRETLEKELGKIGDVVNVDTIDYDRYVGAKIGIHGPSGEKVGKVKATKNQEFLFTIHKV